MDCYEEDDSISHERMPKLSNYIHSGICFSVPGHKSHGPVAHASMSDPPKLGDLKESGRNPTLQIKGLFSSELNSLQLLHASRWGNVQDWRPAFRTPVVFI